MLSKNIHASPALCSSEELHSQGFTKHNSSKWNSSVFLPAFLIPFCRRWEICCSDSLRLERFCQSYLRMQSSRRRPHRVHGEGKSQGDAVFFHNVTITARISTLCVEDWALASEPALRNTELIRTDSKLSMCLTAELNYKVQGKQWVNQHFKKQLKLW